MDSTKTGSLRNVTVTLPVSLLRRAKILAAERDTSLTQLICRSLETLVEENEHYAVAKVRAIQRLREGWDMGTTGRHYAFTREELHER
jgi:hypothetical protein